MVLFNSDKAPKEWYCQGFNGCILFSLINGGYISEYMTKLHLAKVFKPNSPLSKIEKMAELIKRLDHISFTEHDYNKFIKQSKFFLESLDKEHYRYEL